MLSRGLSNATIMHTGRTGALAGAAEQTEIEVFLETFVQIDPSIGGGLDQMDSAARRFRLEACGAIGRTLVQTQPAVDALVELREIESGDLGLAAAL